MRQFCHYACWFHSIQQLQIQVSLQTHSVPKPYREMVLFTICTVSLTDPTAIDRMHPPDLYLGARVSVPFGTGTVSCGYWYRSQIFTWGLPVPFTNSNDVLAWLKSPECYGTAPCLILSHLINHASSILSNELSNTYLISVWLLWNSSLFNFLHFIIVWSCGHYYKVWQLLGITSYCLHSNLILIQPNYILTQLFPYMFFLSHLILSSYLLIFLSLTHLIAGSYPIGGYLDHILLDDKPGIV